jgi:protein-L-isoaspartate(D-aspartate) O-methyltransferase
MPPECEDRSPERARMVAEQLAGRGVHSPTVLEAMARIPRELFLPPSSQEYAYADAALAIDCGQTISQPYMVASMTELLELTPADRVLEIGTGSGYQTAILACLARQVYTIEWHLRLMLDASERLKQLGLTNVRYRCADGSRGWPEQAPFDAVLVTAGAPAVPPSLVEQLSQGGRLVVPVGGEQDQTLVRVRRADAGSRAEEYFKCRFVKLLGREGWQQ